MMSRLQLNIRDPKLARSSYGSHPGYNGGATLTSIMVPSMMRGESVMVLEERASTDGEQQAP